MVRTKWYGQNFMWTKWFGQNGSGQNSAEKMVRTKCYADKMLLDKMVRTKGYGQLGMLGSAISSNAPEVHRKLGTTFN